MILHPAVIALLAAAFLTSLMLLYSSWYAVLIVRKWDLTSGSELQLALERRTYLISTILSYVFGFQLLSLFLYAFTADNLHSFFVGAMCAAGTLNVNAYGYPTLILKIVNFLFAGGWLILNYADNRAYDYPLVKKKYLLLLAIIPFVLLESVMMTAYFYGLQADVITSCCGSLFSSDARQVASELAALPARPMEYLFYGTGLLTCTCGLRFYLRGRGGYLFSFMTVIWFFISLGAIISFISLYFYELPTHHCPFCMLQREYGYVGYPIYIALLGSGITGIGVGILMPFRSAPSLVQVVHSFQRRLTLAALLFIITFTAVVAARMIFTSFVLEG
jgi:hypothetical protein